MPKPIKLYVRDLEEMLEGYEKAIATIRTFHGIGLLRKTEILTWALYQQSPEMKHINASKAKIEEIVRGHRHSKKNN